MLSLSVRLNKKNLSFVSLLMGAVFLSGCMEGSGELKNTVKSAGFSAECSLSPEGLGVRSLNATSDDAWVHFNLEKNAEVFPDDPDNSTIWDIAFQRFRIKVNGGVNGIGGVEVAALGKREFASVFEVPTEGFISDRPLTELSDEEILTLGPNPFFDVCEGSFVCLDEAAQTVDRNHLNSDPANAAFVFLSKGSGIGIDDGEPLLGWYNYHLSEGSILRTAEDVWMIRAAGGVFKFQMLGYYGLNVDRAPGWMNFQWQSMDTSHKVGNCVSQNQKPVAKITTVSLTEGVGPLTVAFDGSTSSDEDGVVSAWSWDFGDGTPLSDEVSPTHVFSGVRSYRVTLTVTDAAEPPSSDTATLLITVQEQAPAPPTGQTKIETHFPIGDRGIYEPEGGGLGGPTAIHNMGGLSIWQSNTGHGGRSLMKFDNALLSGLTEADVVKATLRLYAAGEGGGMAEASPGFGLDSDNPFCAPASCVRIDIMTQGDPGVLSAPWEEYGVDTDGDGDCLRDGFNADALPLDDCGLAWSAVVEIDREGTRLGADVPGIPWATRQIDAQDDLSDGLDLTDNFWFEWDLTDLVKHWIAVGTTGDGIALTQESYETIRADAIPGTPGLPVIVTAFCDKESDSVANSLDATKPHCRDTSVRPHLILELRTP